ncbi:unnamed protein product [Ectocarpus sp. CCAP 1310/34]|nr:unnamed protein product [Ectocarpus sp. CCAP 1310/34]
MLSCDPGDGGTVGNASKSGSVNRTIILMSKRTLVFVFAVTFLGAAVVLLVPVGNCGRSMMLPPERPTTESGSKATLPLSHKKSDEFQTKEDGDTGSTTHTPGTERGGTPWRTSRALEEWKAVVSSPEAKPIVNVRPVEHRHPPGKVAIFVYEGVPELDHMELVQCYRSGHRGVAPWQDERNDMAENMGEIWMHRYVCPALQLLC